MISSEYLDSFIKQALAEDIGSGDHSGNSCIPPDSMGRMQLIIKEDGILAGVEVALRVFTLVDKSLNAEVRIGDGEAVQNGDIALSVSGAERSLLQAERLALNLLQRMSGIATKTRQLADMIAGTHARLLDTRKTTPNLRPLEKQAVLLGGGHNHRMGLYDMIMLKDNHIDFAGGITAAIDKANNYLQANKLTIPIEVETRNFEELEEVIKKGGVQRVMFDNFNISDTEKAVKMVAGKMETESSGGITEKTIRGYAETGVDFISVGALTHSVKSLDMSLKAY